MERAGPAPVGPVGVDESGVVRRVSEGYTTGIRPESAAARRRASRVPGKARWSSSSSDEDEDEDGHIEEDTDASEVERSGSPVEDPASHFSGNCEVVDEIAAPAGHEPVGGESMHPVARREQCAHSSRQGERRAGLVAGEGEPAQDDAAVDLDVLRPVSSRNRRSRPSSARSRRSVLSARSDSSGASRTLSRDGSRRGSERSYDIASQDKVLTRKAMAKKHETRKKVQDVLRQMGSDYAALTRNTTAMKFLRIRMLPSGATDSTKSNLRDRDSSVTANARKSAFDHGMEPPLAEQRRHRRRSTDAEILESARGSATFGQGNRVSRPRPVSAASTRSRGIRSVRRSSTGRPPRTSTASVAALVGLDEGELRNATLSEFPNVSGPDGPARRKGVSRGHGSRPQSAVTPSRGPPRTGASQLHAGRKRSSRHRPTSAMSRLGGAGHVPQTVGKVSMVELTSNEDQDRNGGQQQLGVHGDDPLRAPVLKHVPTPAPSSASAEPLYMDDPHATFAYTYGTAAGSTSGDLQAEDSASFISPDVYAKLGHISASTVEPVSRANHASADTLVDSTARTTLPDPHRTQTVSDQVTVALRQPEQDIPFSGTGSASPAAGIPILAPDRAESGQQPHEPNKDQTSTSMEALQLGPMTRDIGSSITHVHFTTMRPTTKNVAVHLHFAVPHKTRNRRRYIGDSDSDSDFDSKPQIEMLDDDYHDDGHGTGGTLVSPSSTWRTRQSVSSAHNRFSTVRSGRRRARPRSAAPALTSSAVQTTPRNTTGDPNAPGQYRGYARKRAQSASERRPLGSLPTWTPEVAGQEEQGTSADHSGGSRSLGSAMTSTPLGATSKKHYTAGTPIDEVSATHDLVEFDLGDHSFHGDGAAEVDGPAVQSDVVEDRPHMATPSWLSPARARTLRARPHPISQLRLVKTQTVEVAKSQRVRQENMAKTDPAAGAAVLSSERVRHAASIARKSKSPGRRGHGASAAARARALRKLQVIRSFAMAGRLTSSSSGGQSMPSFDGLYSGSGDRPASAAGHLRRAKSSATMARKSRSRSPALKRSKSSGKNSASSKSSKSPSRFRKAAKVARVGARWKAKRKALKSKRAAAQRIQADWRGMKTRKGLRWVAFNASIIQRSFRLYLDRRSFAVCSVQALYKGRAARRELVQKQQTATKLQALFRGYFSRLTYAPATVINGAIRMCVALLRRNRLEMERYFKIEEQLSAAMVLQRWGRGCLVRLLVQHWHDQAWIIQRAYRSHFYLFDAARNVQRTYRGHLGRQHVHEIYCATTIQRRTRLHLARQLYLRKRRAAEREEDTRRKEEETAVRVAGDVLGGETADYLETKPGKDQIKVEAAAIEATIKSQLAAVKHKPNATDEGARIYFRAYDVEKQGRLDFRRVQMLVDELLIPVTPAECRQAMSEIAEADAAVAESTKRRYRLKEMTDAAIAKIRRGRGGAPTATQRELAEEQAKTALAEHTKNMAKARAGGPVPPTANAEEKRELELLKLQKRREGVSIDVDQFVRLVNELKIRAKAPGKAGLAADDEGDGESKAASTESLKAGTSSRSLVPSSGSTPTMGSRRAMKAKLTAVSRFTNATGKRIREVARLSLIAQAKADARVRARRNFRRESQPAYECPTCTACFVWDTQLKLHRMHPCDARDVRALAGFPPL